MLIYSTNKFGHYKDYEILFSKLLSAQVVPPGIQQYSKILSKEPIVFSDGDASHLHFLPFIAIRGILGLISVFSMVRTEIMLSPLFRHRVKNLILQTWRKLFRLKLISNHYGRPEPEVERFNDIVVLEPQMWDLPFLMDATEPSQAVKDIFKDHGGKYLLIAGKINSKRCAVELVEWLKGGNLGLTAVVAGGGIEYEAELTAFDSVRVVPGFLRNQDLWHLYKNARVVYCFYDFNVQRPSGIFGRAVQFQKPVIIRRNGFLDSVYKYERAIPVVRMPETILECCLESIEVNVITRSFDQSGFLRDSIQRYQ